jgi:hypothetical protein
MLAVLVHQEQEHLSVVAVAEQVFHLLDLLEAIRLVVHLQLEMMEDKAELVAVAVAVLLLVELLAQVVVAK